ncbi:MAG: hypothetical protein FD153_2033 [Rhodospirillaceae bacterium]|nr:MAG: hypothetical protein FD153_2033 [Rhodospirillaceae bacterium]
MIPVTEVCAKPIRDCFSLPCLPLKTDGRAFHQAHALLSRFPRMGERGSRW